jgi:hypothetical protein
MVMSQGSWSCWGHHPGPRFPRHAGLNLATKQHSPPLPKSISTRGAIPSWRMLQELGQFTLGTMTLFNLNFMTLVITFSLKKWLDPNLPKCQDTEAWKFCKILCIKGVINGFKHGYTSQREPSCCSNPSSKTPSSRAKSIHTSVVDH